MKDIFTFKKFSVQQDRCGMKVGTDGVLLGAWANGGSRVLDIGTGTGLIALMMAQRYADALILGIDIDNDACIQAGENIKNSIYSDRIKIQNKSIQEYALYADTKGYKFDAIVTNPPYFNNSLKSKDIKREMARHTSTLRFTELISCANALLSDLGEFSLIVPTNYVNEIISETNIYGLILSREYHIKTTCFKPSKRSMLAFRKISTNDIEKKEVVLQESNGKKSLWLHSLTNDFYL